MSDDALRRFLVRLVMDDGLRQTLRDDPEAAFDGSGLTAEQREVLVARDERMLALIAGTFDAPREAPPPAPDPVQVEPSYLMIRLVPQAWQDEAGQLQLAYQASVHPWPSETPPGAVSFLMRVAPRAVHAGGGQVRLTYSASIQPAPRGEAPPAAPPSEDSPWGHRVDDAAARAAAEAVKAAPPEERYDRLLDLISAITS